MLKLNESLTDLGQGFFCHIYMENLSLLSISNINDWEVSKWLMHYANVRILYKIYIKQFVETRTVSNVYLIDFTTNFHDI